MEAPIRCATRAHSGDQAMKGWNSLMWGVRLLSHKPGERCFLLGRTWDRDFNLTHQNYDGEPTRCLLFTTRAKARDWCKQAKERHSASSPTWTFQPVRVRETVEEIKP